MTTGNAVVDAIGTMHFEGNVIPHSWYQTPLLRFENGKVNAVAITMLSDIVYWYRPTVIRDEATNRVLEVRKKFKGHRLQKDYERWAFAFGFTKRQFQDAATFLEQAGLIVREVQKPLNICFFEPVAEMVQQITANRLTPEREPAPVEANFASHSNVNRPTSQRKPCTKSTPAKNKHKTAAPNFSKSLKPEIEEAAMIAYAEMSDAQRRHYIEQQAQLQGCSIAEVMWRLEDYAVVRVLRRNGW